MIGHQRLCGRDGRQQRHDTCHQGATFAGRMLGRALRRAVGRRCVVGTVAHRGLVSRNGGMAERRRADGRHRESDKRQQPGERADPDHRRDITPVGYRLASEEAYAASGRELCGRQDVMTHPLAERRSRCNITGVTRFRALAAFLSCLAVLAAGFMTAAAAVPSSALAGERSAASAPCSHCDDCDSMPCPMPAAACLQTSPTSTPTLADTPFSFAATGSSKIHWSFGVTTLAGLSPPPDPFPPRA